MMNKKIKRYLTFLLWLSLSAATNCYARIQDTTTHTLSRAQFISSQTAKADTLNQQALQLAVPGADSQQLNEAIRRIMQGLHIYSKYRDSTGLRQTFDHLALVYHLQKKYVQAKWFYIQSNSMARDMRDTLQIIHSLLSLSSVKTDIKDYPMAQRDLKEALELAKTRPLIDLQIEVQKAYADYYTKKGDARKSATALNRIIFLKDSVAKQHEAEKMDLLRQQARQQAKVQQAIRQKQVVLDKEELRVNTLLKQKNGITIISVSVITILSVLLLILYLRKKRKKRKKKK